jgi:hypothetical protein
MPRDRKRKDPLDEPDDLLAPEEDPPEDPPGDRHRAEPEPTQFDDEPDEHETVPLHSETVLDDEAEPPPSDVSDEDGLLAPEGVNEAPGEDENEDVADEVSLSRELDPDPTPPDSVDATADESSEDEGPASAWDEDLEDGVGGGSESEWAELEHEGQLLAPGRVVVGYKEFVSFPDEGVKDLQARCDTGEARSILYGTSESLGGGLYRLTVGDHVMETKGSEEDGQLFVRARLVLGGASRRVAFQVVDRIAESPVVLGRDALEGYFVVDVALGYIHKSAAGA